MKLKLNRNLRQSLQLICHFYLILLVAPLLFGCESSQEQTAKISPSFKRGDTDHAYAQVVKDVYMRAWQPSTNTVLSDTLTRTMVTIGKDGNVMSTRILKSSGNRLMDVSVQKTLDDVKYIQPFENGSKDVARTFIINFDSRAEKLSKNASLAVYVSDDIPSQGKTIAPFEQYDTAFRNSITKSWYALLDKQKFVQPKTSKVVLQFRLTCDGQITNMKVLENSAGDELALICRKAVLAPVPYKHWPEDMIRMVGTNYREMTFTFNYW